MAEQKVIANKIHEVLNGDALKNALNLATFLRANDFSPEWHSGEGWSVIYNNESIGFILVNGQAEEPGPWTIWFNSCDFDNSVPVTEDLKETVWAHVSTCWNYTTGGKECGCGDQPGRHHTIFGKEYDNVCHSPLMFSNPDSKALEDVKSLLLLLK